MADSLIHARDLLVDRRVRHLAVLDDADEVVGLIGFRDMLAGTEQLYLEDLREALEQRDRALSQSRRHLQLAERVIAASLKAIIITDADNRIELVKPAFTHLTGYIPEEVIGRTPDVLSSGRHDAAFYRDMWDTLRTHGYWRGEIWNRRKSGQLYLEQLTITAIADESGTISHYAALFTDITDIRENEQRVQRLAYYDALAGLPNRRLIDAVSAPVVLGEEQVRAWLDAGLKPPRVAINLSARQFWQEGFVASVSALFERWCLPPGAIGFELTESVLLDHQQQAAAVLARRRELGCAIAIDDFGTGYSLPSYLQDLPVDTLKIDRSFVQRLDAPDARGSAAIVAAVTGLARELGLQAVAEGVETEAQRAALARHPVVLLQGYLTGKPLAPDAFAVRWLGGCHTGAAHALALI